MNSKFITEVLIIFASVVCYTFGGPSDPVPRPDQWWIDRHNAYVENTKNSNGSIPIIFYGDSITEGWGGAGNPVFQEKYAPLGVANYGIGGDRTEHVLWRIIDGEIEGLSPKLIVLKIGTNNIGAATTTEISEGVRTIVGHLRRVLPTTKILLLGVLPRSNADVFALVSDINIKISGLSDGTNVRYLNMFDHFAESWGVVRPDLFSPDTVHLERPGYERWSQVMEHVFEEMLES